ncbi:MAG: MerC domain-containing protein [Planctomycetota bacterium JB042]
MRGRASDSATTTAPVLSVDAWHPGLDRLGVIASIGCAVHCLVAPFVLLLAPVLGGVWAHPAAHLAIACVVLPVALHTLRRGHAMHGRRRVLAIGGIGVALVLIGTILPFLPSAPGDLASAPAACHECCPTARVDAESGTWTISFPPASIVTLLGGIALVVAHVGNLRGCRACG